jgi:hypothetical protein
MHIPQANTHCQGEPYTTIRSDDTYHESLDLHANDRDHENMHYHRLAACIDKKTGQMVGETLITPREVRHFFYQLEIIQRNKTHLEKIHNDPEYLQFLAKLFGKNSIKLPPYQARDFISHNDSEAFKKSYQQFYSDNKEFFAERIKYNEPTAPKPKKARVLPTIAISAGLAAGIVCLRDAMIYNGISKKHADQVVDFLLIAFIAKFSESFTPALVATATHLVLKNLPQFEGSSMLKNLVGIIVYAVNSESPLSAASAIRYATTALTTFYSANLMRAINHTLFGAYPVEASPQQHYAGLRPGFLNQ